MSKNYYVVLKVIDNENSRVLPSYVAQVAMVHTYKSMNNAAEFNIGTHPEAAKLRKPYRSIVIPWEHWHEFEVYSEREKGHDRFRAYPNEANLTIQKHDPNTDQFK